jgi:hypothetical protein
MNIETYLEYENKPKIVKAKKFILNNLSDRINMFKEISDEDTTRNEELQMSLINALIPKNEYYVILYDNGNIGWQETSVFEEEYRLLKNQ